MRELHSLENFAQCDTVCLDKTGMLTEGNLSVEGVYTDIDSEEFEKLMSAYINNTDDNNSTYTAREKPFCSVHAPTATVREKAIMTLLSFCLICRTIIKF